MTGSTGLTTRPAPSARSELLRGPALVRALGVELSARALEWEVPLTARTAWLMATMTGRRDIQPWGVLLRGHDGRARAMMVLADEADEAGRLRTTLLGTDLVHRGAVLADDVAAAYDLGACVATALLSRPHLGAVRLGPLPVADPKVAALATGMGIVELVDEDPIPVVQRRGTLATEYLPPGTRRTLRKAANRLRTDGLPATFDIITDPPTIRGWLPELLQHHQARDHAHGRASAVDEPAGAALWLDRVEALLSEGLELATLSIDGRLAAYVLGVVDGTVFRLLDGRFIDGWARYAPGRMLETAALQRVLDDPTLTQLDWMTAIAPETLLTQNCAEPVVTLRLRNVP